MASVGTLSTLRVIVPPRLLSAILEERMQEDQPRDTLERHDHYSDTD